jgi:hypothetical protein
MKGESVITVRSGTHLKPPFLINKLSADFARCNEKNEKKVKKAMKLDRYRLFRQWILGPSTRNQAAWAPFSLSFGGGGGGVELGSVCGAVVVAPPQPALARATLRRIKLNKRRRIVVPAGEEHTCETSSRQL